MAKLLIVSHAYPPSNAPAAQRSFFFGKYLKQVANIDVDLITPRLPVTGAGQSDWAEKHQSAAFVHYTKYAPFTRMLFGSLSNSNGPSSPISFLHRLKAVPKRIIRSLMIPDRGIIWYPYALRTGSKVIRADSTISCILTSSPSFSDHLVGSRLKKRTGVKWVADFRDFHWIDARENTHTGLAAKMNKRAERIVVEQADACTFISESMRDEYVSRYPELDGRAHAIYNGYDPVEFPADVPDTQRKLTIFYSGSFYSGQRCPKPLLRAIDELLAANEPGAKEIKIQIAGNIDVDSKDILREFESSNLIEYLGVIPRREVLRRMSQADLLWLIVGNLKAHCQSFPVKGYEYIGAHRPILAFCPQDSESNRILRENGCGTTFSSDSPLEQITTHLRGFLQTKMRGMPVLLDESKTGERFTRIHQAQQLGELIHSLTTPAKS